MRKQLIVEDFTMIFQWIVIVLLTPFILLPLFPRQDVSFTVRGGIVVAIWIFSGVMTAIYLKVRSSRHAAGMVVNVTALIDVIAIFVCLMIWPKYLPDLFWIFPLLVIVVGTRFSYREAAIAALGLSGLYAVTIITRLGTAPTRTVIGDTLVRIIFLLLVALATVYVTQREKRQRRDANILSRVAAAIGATLDPNELMQIVVEGMSQVAGLGRASAFLVSSDGHWALPESTTEKDPQILGRFKSSRIDLRRRNVASKVVEERRPVIMTDLTDSDLIDRRWSTDFGMSALLAMPILLRDEVKGIVFVERHRALARDLFSEREVKTCESILAQASAGLENALRYEEEQKKRSESDILYKTSRELTSSLEMDRVLENACRLAIDNANAGGCSAFVLDESNGTLVPRVSVGAGGAKRTEFPKESGMPLAEVDDMYSLAQHPPAMLIHSPAANLALPPFLREEGAVLLVPFYAHGRITGLLCIDDEEGREFSDSQISQLAALAGETSLAVLNARLHERIKSDAAQLSSLVQLANAIGSTADLNTIMAIALDTVHHLFDCSSGLIYRIDEHDGTMRHVDSFGYPEEILDKISSPPFPQADECWTVKEDRLICIDDLSQTKLACRTLEKIGQGSTVCVGMQVEGRTLGVLHVRSNRPNAFGEEDQQLALAIADEVALALQRALLFEEINRLAITDPLTGVFNVRRLEEVMQDEVSRAKRYGRPVSFVMVDVDNLKSYNDTLGHQKGDVVLSQIASIVDSNTRDVDKVFRYGGDEFCVVLPETDLDDAMTVAEKVRRAVAEFHFPGEERVPGGGMTVSAGVSSFPENSLSEEELVRQADVALYLAKQQGRNSVQPAS